MQSHQPPPIPSADRPTRSLFVTVLAWAIIVISALITPISAISFLMILAKSHGTSSTTLSGFLFVVVLPPAALVAGIGLLGRRVWAWYGVVALMGLLIVLNVAELMKPPRPTMTTTSPSGVKTTVMGSSPNYHSLPMVVVCGALLVRLLMPVVRAEFRKAVVKLEEADRSEADLAHAALPGIASSGGVPLPPIAQSRPVTPAQQRNALIIAILVLLAITILMGWLVIGGLSSGTTYWPSKMSSHQREVLRQEEPVMFFISIITYAVVGLGTGVLTVWLLVASLRGNAADGERSDRRL